MTTAKTVAMGVQQASDLDRTNAFALNLLNSKAIKTLIAEAAKLSNDADVKANEAKVAGETEKGIFRSLAVKFREEGWRREFYDAGNGAIYSSIAIDTRKAIARSLYADRPEQLACYLASDESSKHYPEDKSKIRRDIGVRVNKLVGQYMLEQHLYLDLLDDGKERFNTAREEWKDNATKASDGDPTKLLEYAAENPAPVLGEGKWTTDRDSVFAREAERVSRKNGNFAACLSIAQSCASITGTIDSEWSDGTPKLGRNAEQQTRMLNALRELRAVVVQLVPNDMTGNAALKKALDNTPGSKSKK